MNQNDHELTLTHQFFEHSPNLICVVNRQGKLETVNSKALAFFGFEEDEVHGTPIASLIEPTQTEAMRAVLEQCQPGNSPAEFTCSCLRTGGKCCDVHWQIFSGEQPEWTFLMGTEVSSTKVGEEQLLRENLEARFKLVTKMESLGGMAGGIAHSFNSLLTTIQGYTELAIAHRDYPEQVKRYLKEVVIATARSSELVEQILTFCKHTKRSVRPINLSETVQEIGNVLRTLLPVTVELNISVPRENIIVLADHSELHQLFYNLGVNAHQALDGKDGSLQIHIHSIEESSNEESNYVQIDVIDDGVGMESTVLERIFDPFYSTKPSGIGTGMGLPVARSIVQELQGKIKVESKPGLGTTFRIWLPVATTTSEPQESTTITSRKHVLLVDDDQKLVELLTTILEHLGHQVTPAYHPNDALTRFKQNATEFDLVISDQSMPGMSGLSLVQSIRQFNEDIPIILISGFGASAVESCENMSEFQFIKKPISMTQLQEVLENL